MNTEVGLAALLLGEESALELDSSFAGSLQDHIRAISPTESRFMKRLREVLVRVCKTVGAESAAQQLRLPQVVGQYFVERCEEVELTPNQMKVAGVMMRPVVAITEEESKTGVSEEVREKIVRLYKKGIKVQYLTELFGVESPLLVHSWGNWVRRPTAEAECNMSRRAQVLSLLRQGEMPKSICNELHLKPKVYRELIGQCAGQVFSRAMYDSVKQQMAILKIKNIVSKNTGVSVYIINKWLEDKDIPGEDLVVSDETGLRDTKLEAIELFYDTGSSTSVAVCLGLEPGLVKQWVREFQKAVDSKFGLE